MYNCRKYLRQSKFEKQIVRQFRLFHQIFFKKLSMSFTVFKGLRFFLPRTQQKMVKRYSFLLNLKINTFYVQAWAEVLRFGDRMFYTVRTLRKKVNENEIMVCIFTLKDWWNSCSYQEYFRTWNCLVQDWIHLYIYTALNKVKKARIFYMIFHYLY